MCAASRRIGEFDVLFKTWSPHLVLSDVRDARHDGRRALQSDEDSIRRGTSRSCFFPTCRMQSFRQIATESGADGYLSKSQDVAALVHHVKVYCAMAYSPERACSRMSVWGRTWMPVPQARFLGPCRVCCLRRAPTLNGVARVYVAGYDTPTRSSVFSSSEALAFEQRALEDDTGT